MKVFHTAGPAYAHLFETVESEIRKYIYLGNKEMATVYRMNSYEPATMDQMSKQYIKNVESLESFGHSK